MVVSRFKHVTSGGLGQFVLSLCRIDGSDHYVDGCVPLDSSESLFAVQQRDRRVAELLDLDVGVIARGRRHLLEQDVEVDRVRRVGAGRKRVEKKPRKSSSRSRR